MSSWLRSLRPQQWTKNLAVFAGLVFSGRAEDPDIWLLGSLAFACFCLASSAVYLFNDVLDVERDRAHPVKRKRPIASGAIPVPAALIGAALLAAAALSGSFAISMETGLIYASYLGLQLAYCLRLKHVFLLDVMCIGTGFLLRLLAGVYAVEAEFSPWLVACGVQLALFLALCKRKAEASYFETHGSEGETRPTLEDYAGQATNVMISVLASTTLMTYTLYTLLPGAALQLAPKTSSSGAPGMVWTLPPVLYGLLRYLFLVYRCEEGERPEQVLLSDRPLLTSLLIYAGIVGAVLYWAPVTV